MSGTYRERLAGFVAGGTSLEDRQAGPSMAPTAPFVRARLIPALAARFDVVRELPASGEADVMVVRDRQGQLFVVKQYRRLGWSPSPEVLDILTKLRANNDAESWAADRCTQHLVWLEDLAADPATGLFWELQEYLSGGALAGQSDGTDGRPRGASWSRLGDWPIKVLVSGLAEAVASFHQLIGAHRDLKPGNVLVRSRDPLVLVLADLGLARHVGDQSALLSRRDGSPPYQAPEAAQGTVSLAVDWWAVGMMVAEAALGRHPLALPDGTLPDERAIQSELAQRDVPLDGIVDERVRNLCQGLLTRDSQQRWRVAQVRAWLAGNNPPSYRNAGAPDLPRVPGSRVRSVRFAGKDHDTLQSLAAAFAAEPERAGELLFTGKDAVLLEDLRLMLSQHQLAEAQSVLVRYRSGAWQPAFLRLLVEMDPQLEPTLAGQDMTPAGIEALSLRIMNDGTATPEQETAMAWVLDHDLWRIWRGQPGMDGAGAAADRLPRGAQLKSSLAAAGSPGVGHYAFLQPGGRSHEGVATSASVLAVSGGAPVWVKAASDDIVLLDHEVACSFWARNGCVARAWVLAQAVNPAIVTPQLDHALAACTRSSDQAWWNGLADSPIPHERAVALVSAGLARQADIALGNRNQRLADEQRRQQEQAAREAKARREQEAQVRQREERRRQAAVAGSLVASNVIMAAVGVAATGIAWLGIGSWAGSFWTLYPIWLVFQCVLSVACAYTARTWLEVFEGLRYGVGWGWLGGSFLSIWLTFWVKDPWIWLLPAIPLGFVGLWLGLKEARS